MNHPSPLGGPGTNVGSLEAETRASKSTSRDTGTWPLNNSFFRLLSISPVNKEVLAARTHSRCIRLRFQCSVCRAPSMECASLCDFFHKMLGFWLKQEGYRQKSARSPASSDHGPVSRSQKFTRKIWSHFRTFWKFGFSYPNWTAGGGGGRKLNHHKNSPGWFLGCFKQLSFFWHDSVTPPPSVLQLVCWTKSFKMFYEDLSFKFKTCHDCMLRSCWRHMTQLPMMYPSCTWPVSQPYAIFVAKLDTTNLKWQ